MTSKLSNEEWETLFVLVDASDKVTNGPYKGVDPTHPRTDELSPFPWFEDPREEFVKLTNFIMPIINERFDGHYGPFFKEVEEFGRPIQLSMKNPKQN